jgi:hypothetical protein
MNIKRIDLLVIVLICYIIPGNILNEITSFNEQKKDIAFMFNNFNSFNSSLNINNF